MAKTKSFGTAVTIATVAIKGITDMSFSGADVPFLDMTSHDSTAKEFTSGLVDYGTFEMTINFDASDAGQDDLRAATGTSKAFVVTLPNASTISFSAIVGVASESIPLEGVVSYTISCKLTGAKTYSAT
jgi:hypothetical protein